MQVTGMGITVVLTTITTRITAMTGITTNTVSTTTTINGFEFEAMPMKLRPKLVADRATLFPRLVLAPNYDNQLRFF